MCIHTHVDTYEWSMSQDTYHSDVYTHLIHMCPDSFMWYYLLLCDMTHSYVTWLKQVTWSTWAVLQASTPPGRISTCMCTLTHSYMSWLIQVTFLVHVWYDSFICDMTHTVGVSAGVGAGVGVGVGMCVLWDGCGCGGVGVGVRGKSDMKYLSSIPSERTSRKHKHKYLWHNSIRSLTCFFHMCPTCTQHIYTHAITHSHTQIPATQLYQKSNIIAFYSFICVLPTIWHTLTHTIIHSYTHIPATWLH